MKILASIFTILLLVSVSVSAEEHFFAAKDHTHDAVIQGEAGHTRVLVEHVKAVLENALKASLNAKGMQKSHLDAAATELQESLDLATMGHIGAATLHAEAAERHIKASNE
jgi:hypothetical protein